MTRGEFLELLRTLEAGWNTGDAAAVAACFAERLEYTDSQRYCFTSRAELLPFFTLQPGETQHVDWHAIVFDEEQQAGAAEYTYTGSYTYHGLVLIRVADGLVTLWREYQFTEEERQDGQAATQSGA